MRHVVLLQHGSHGTCRDLAYFRNILEKQLNVVVFETNASEGHRTHDGIVRCARRFADEFQKVSTQLFAEERVVLSVVGHSLGGLILRDALTYLQFPPHVTFGTFCSIASPHCGVSQLPVPLRCVGKSVAFLGSQSYKDMFRMSQVVEDALVSKQHLECWSKFNRHVFVFTPTDRVVPAQSSTLVSQLPACHIEDNAVTSFVPWAASLNGSHTTEQKVARQLLDNVQNAVIVRIDFRRLMLDRFTNAALSVGAHRALVCKAPFDDTKKFGFISEYLAREVLAVK